MPAPGERPLVRIVAIVFVLIPLAFGAVRWIQTGTDDRYLVLATAAIVASALAYRATHDRLRSPWVRGALSFVLATAASVVVARIQGATSIPAVAVVAVGFATCTTVAGVLGFLDRAVPDETDDAVGSPGS